jgi:threonine dehydrogenase-like Zn-dependent dehydrogenase
VRAAVFRGPAPFEAGADAVATLAAVRAEGVEPDIAFECSGATPGFTAALRVVRPGGRVVAVALYHEPLPFDRMAFVHGEVELRGSVCYRLPAAFEMQCRSKDAIKVMIRP